jgi:hypothetical protein
MQGAALFDLFEFASENKQLFAFGAHLGRQVLSL